MKIVRRSTQVTATVFPDTVRISFVYKQDSVFTVIFVRQGNVNVSENKKKLLNCKVIRIRIQPKEVTRTLQ